MVAGAAACSSEPAGPEGADFAAAPVAPAPAPGDTDPAKSTPRADAQGYEYTIVIHVTNNTSKTLVWAGNEIRNNGNISPAPAATIAPGGGTDTVFFNSSNVEGAGVEPTWTVQGTNQIVGGIFSVPPLARNGATCQGNPLPTTCSIDTGYHPNAGLTISE